jgi:hypothetical protein
MLPQQRASQKRETKSESSGWEATSGVVACRARQSA